MTIIEDELQKLCDLHNKIREECSVKEDKLIIKIDTFNAITKETNEQLEKIIEIYDKEIKIHTDAVQYWKNKVKK